MSVTVQVKGEVFTGQFINHDTVRIELAEGTRDCKICETCGHVILPVTGCKCVLKK